MKSQDAPFVPVSYLPFVWSPKKSGYPPEIAATIERDRVYEISDDFQTAASLLYVDIDDLLFLIFPDHHRNATGKTFRNISYYTNRNHADAFTKGFDGVCRTTFSIGQVRLLAGLAAEVFRLVDPILFGVPERPSRWDLGALMRETQKIDHAAYCALIEEYPRFIENRHKSFDCEFILFADMLRFVWCHEWAHGLAGHTTLQGRAYPLALRAMEFEADSVALTVMLRQILHGNDMPGRLVSFQGDITHRIFWMLLAASVVTTYWYEAEQDVGPEEQEHPPSEFRYLNAWDTIRAHMITAGPRLAEKQFALNAQLTDVIFRLGEACPSFVPMRQVTPFVLETKFMKCLRDGVDTYIRIADALVQDARYQIDFSIDEAVPDAEH